MKRRGFLASMMALVCSPLAFLQQRKSKVGITDLMIGELIMPPRRKRFVVNGDSPLLDGLQAFGDGKRMWKRDESGPYLRFTDKESGESIPVVTRIGADHCLLASPARQDFVWVSELGRWALKCG